MLLKKSQGLAEHFILSTACRMDILLTLVRTESPFLVVIIAISGSTPQLAIAPSLTGAGVVLLTQEFKGEVAGFSLRVSTNHSSVWPKQTHKISSWKTNHCDHIEQHLFIVVSVTHHDWGRIHILRPCQNWLWWNTSGSHHCDPLWCSCHILYPGR